MSPDDDVAAPSAPRADPGVYGIRFARGRAMKSQMYLRFFEYGEPDAPQSCDFWFWVVIDPGRITLFDTGFDRRYADPLGLEIDISLTEGLGHLGLRPDDVDEIVVSHLHSDHTGNLPLFTSAALTLQQREWDFWFGPFGRRGLFAKEMRADYLADIAAAAVAGRLRVVDGDHHVAPGLRVELLPGHSPGSQVLIAETGTDPLVLASDVVHFDEELTDDRPFVIAADVADMYASFDRIRALQSDGMRIVSGHESTLADGDEILARGPGVADVIRLARRPSP